MALPVVTALSRRDRMWPAVIVSVALHAAAVAWVVVRTPPPPIDLEQKPIVAKLVRLGEKRPEEWLPRKPAEPPPAVAPPAPAPPQPAAAAAPSPAPAPAAAAKPAPAAPRAPAPPGARPGPEPKPGTTLASVLSQVRKQQDPVYGSPDGDPAGDAERAEEGDRYLALIDRELRTNYRVPATITDRERMQLQAVVVVYVEPDGVVSRWRFESRSGNAAFDDALERTLRQLRLPPPPDAQREFYRRTGVAVNFRI
jgi:colicin import membrane protein/protein TonB